VKLAKSKLKQIIKEELSKVLKEDDWPADASGLSIHGEAEKLWGDMSDDEQDELIKTHIDPLLQSIEEKVREHLWNYFDKVKKQNLEVHLAVQWLLYSEGERQSGAAIRGLKKYLNNVWPEANQWSADGLPETGGGLLEELRGLLDGWKPETDEGIKYKSDLAEVVERHSEGYSEDEEEEELVDVGGEGLAGETAEKTLADYKENPEFFN